MKANTVHSLLRSIVILWTMLSGYTKSVRQLFRAQDTGDAIAWAVTEDAVLGRCGWSSVTLRELNLHIDPLTSEVYS